MTTKYTIYLLTNTITNKQYVGLTRTTLQKRWSTHKSSAKHGSDNRKLANSIRKHGTECWQMTAICSAVGVANAAFCEKHLIALYDTYLTGYNSSLGGELYDGYISRAAKTDAQKQHLSDIHIGKSYHPGQSGENNPRFGKPGTMLGKQHSDSTRIKLKQAWNNETRKRELSSRFSIPVTFEGITYPNKTEAAKLLGFSTIPQLNKYMKTTSNGVLEWRSTPPKQWIKRQQQTLDQTH